MTNAEKLLAAARAYIGVPFRHLGRNRAGLDCVGLLLVSAADAGIPADDPGTYDRGHRGRDMLEWLAARFDRVALPHASDGDILVFNSQDTHFPCHVGLASTQHLRPAVIHAQVGRGAVLEERLHWHLTRQMRAAFRLREG